MKHKVLYVARIRIAGLLSDRKWYVILAIIGMFSYYIYTPLIEICSYYQIPVSPWIFPLYMSMYRMLVVHGGLCILLYADVIPNDSFSQMMIIRCGRKSYILGEWLYIMIAGLLYTGITFLFSLLWSLPVIRWETDWGIMLRTIAESLGNIMQQTGVSVSFSLTPDMLRLHQPIALTGYYLLFMWLSTVFTGVVIGGVTILWKRMAGLVTMGILVCMTMFSMFFGNISLGKWVSYLSPLTWSNPAFMDWYQNIYPSPQYAFCVYVITILGMGILGTIFYCGKDLKTEANIK